LHKKTKTAAQHKGYAAVFGFAGLRKNPCPGLVIRRG